MELTAESLKEIIEQRSNTGPLMYSLDDYIDAPSTFGPLAYTWEDKPHRLVYDLVKEIKRLREILSQNNINENVV